MSDMPALSELGRETLIAADNAHSAFLRRFARSKRNELRIEVRLFWSLMKELAEWADQHRGLEALANRAWWWESYWYEREYGDSEFYDLTNEQERILENYRVQFDIDHVALWLPTVNFESLAVEINRAATNNVTGLIGLTRLSPKPHWKDLRFALDRSGCALRALLLNAVADGISKTNPAKYTNSFLAFLQRLNPSFSINWTESELSVDIALTEKRRHVIGYGPLSDEVNFWICDQEVSYECDDKVSNLFEELAKAA